MNDAICFVQFLHPGYEPPVPSDGEVPWNTKELHKRKFLRSHGAYLDDEGARVEDELVFWGEWEPPSRAVPLAASNRLEPHWLHTPFRERRDGWAQNTDPFVFGDRFRYSICQQHRSPGRPTQLAKLLPGSVILFGSGLGGAFRLDTVLVIARVAARHGLSDPPRMDGDYGEVVMKPYYSALGDQRIHSLYEGATPEDDVAGMYSFFPCKRHEEAPKGFARPTISMPQIKATHKQSYKRTFFSSPQDVAPLWHEVLGQVRKQHCLLGVRTEMPALRASAVPPEPVAAGSC